MAGTVIQYVLRRLGEIGVKDVFGVPGDYAFAVNDAICNDPDVKWIGCCNELNAAYAAEGYARINGAGALCTTYGVGELSAINGVAGAYAEHLPVFHLVEAPNVAIQESRALMHHTLGNGDYDLFRRMSEPVVCAHAVMTPQNVAYNEIAPWRYSLLPRAFGCDDWLSARVATCGELDGALAAAGRAETGVYIEIVTDAYAASALATRMHEEFRKLYR